MHFDLSRHSNWSEGQARAGEVMVIWATESWVTRIVVMNCKGTKCAIVPIAESKSKMP